MPLINKYAKLTIYLELTKQRYKCKNCNNELLLEKFNVAISYMFDIEGNFGSPVGNITDEDIRIPYSLLVDVLSGREDMNFLEKCNGSFNSIGIILSSVLLGLVMSSCPISIKKSFTLSRELYSDIKKDYLILKRKK